MKSYLPLRKGLNMPDIETIKRAILANCGGWNGATDPEFAAKWASLTPEQQAAYLNLDGSELTKKTKAK